MMIVILSNCLYNHSLISKRVSNPCSGLHVLQLFVREPEERLGVKGNIRQHKFFSNTDWDALEQRQVPAPFKPTIVSIVGSLCGLQNSAHPALHNYF